MLVYFTNNHVRLAVDLALLKGATLADIAKEADHSPDKLTAHLKDQDGKPPALGTLTWRASASAIARDKALVQLEKGKPKDLDEWVKAIGDACKAGATRDDVQKAIRQFPVSRSSGIQEALSRATTSAGVARHQAIDAFKTEFNRHARDRAVAVASEIKAVQARLRDLNKAMAAEQGELDGVDALLGRADWILEQSKRRKALEAAAVAAGALPNHIRQKVDAELERGLIMMLPSNLGDAATILAQAERTTRRASGTLAELRREQEAAKWLLDALETETSWLRDQGYTV